MSWQTCEALAKRKLNNWVRRGIITREQRGKILDYCYQYGFWDALGYATRLKYKNNPNLKKKYQYKSEKIPKKNCLLVITKTTGSMSMKGRKRMRKWRNIYYKPDGSEQDFVRGCYGNDVDGWKVFLVNRKAYVIGWRKEI